MFKRTFVSVASLTLFAALASGQTCILQAPSAPTAVQVFSPIGGSFSKQFRFFSFGCAWRVSADVPWITFSSATSGSGITPNVFIFGTVAPNAGPVPLHGTITLTQGEVIVERFPITVTSNSCSYSVNPPSAHFGRQGGSGQFTLTATPDDCFPFDPDSQTTVSLTTTGRANYDHGVFYYGIAPNSGTAINATATLSSQPSATFTVTQDGGDGSLQAGCPLSGVPRVGSSFAIQCTAVGGNPPYTWSLASGSFPPGVSLSFGSVNFGAPTIEGPFSFGMTVKDSSTPTRQIANVTVSGVVFPSNVAIPCSGSGPVEAAAFYFGACGATGGSGSYQWAISDGALPNGLALSPGPSGGIIISGVPTDSGSYYYALQLSDTSTPRPLIAVRRFAGLLQSTPPQLSLSCAEANPVFVVGQSYTSFSCTASGGIAPVRYSLTGGLPPGFSSSGNIGSPFIISGIPTTAGEFKFVVQASDSSSVAAQAAQRSFDITVVPRVTATCTPSDGPTLVGQFYSTTCAVSGGQPPYTFAPPSSLPAGLTFTQTGPASASINGTPTTASPFYSYGFSVSDSARNGGGPTFSGSIAVGTPAPPGLTITCNPPTVGGFEVGLPMVPVQCVANGGKPPYVWLPQGTIAAGLTISTSANTASLSGTPTATGAVFDLLVADSSTPKQTARWGPGGYVAARLLLSCLPAAGPVSVGQVFSSNCSVTGGVSPLTWSVSGNLPPGIVFDYSTFGVPNASIHGSPTTVGPYDFTVNIQDSAAQPVTASQNFAGTISAVGAAILLTCSSSGSNYTGGVAITPTTCTVSGGMPPYQWSISNGSLPLGLNLAPVAGGMAVGGIPMIAGIYSCSITVTDSGGQTALWPFSTVVSNPYTPGAFNPFVLPHLTFGGGWQTRIVLSSIYYSADTASLRFYGDSGNPIGVPHAQVATGSGSTASFFDQQIPSNGVVFLDTSAAASDPVTNGSARLSSSYSGITGFGVFSYPSLNWQALVPMDNARYNSVVLAFDNTGSLATGVSMASTDSIPINVSVVVSDDNGAVLETTSIPLGAGAHTSFMLKEQFPSTAGKRGTVRFTTDTYGSIHVLAIRANGPALTTLPVLASNGGNPGASIAHVTYNAGFTSTFYLVNTGTAAAPFTLKFFNESGGAVSVPLLLPQTGMTTTTNALTMTLAAGAMLVVKTQSNSSLAGVVGSAQLTTFGTVGGFEIFEWTTYGQEASVPLQSQSSSSGVGRRLIFDNTGGFATGVAVANPGGIAGSITVNIRDEGGNLLQTSAITLPINGHTSFMLPSTYPITNGIRGSVEFAAQFFQPSVIGIRAGSGGTLTTIPAL